ncbi:glucose 1-dehydrogenase [Demetria terragena]|uniref:glucose 1-dehydrogenase n=1 Tax=Demetria terragena TaxID=63959 RepID=UPI0004756445|nr:glucose 1-dehydrogenase [Demetria terragena]
MRALTVIPGQIGSAAVLDVDEPDPAQGDVLVQGLAVGICGTDHEIIEGLHGQAPPGSERLILGHESLGRVVEAPGSSAVTPGDLVVGIVRHPDPVPCSACAHGEWDMCRNGQFTEHGIQGLAGFASQRWRAQGDHVVRLDPALSEVGTLLEPTTVVTKAWEQVDRIGERAWFSPQTVLVTGAGPIGLLAAMVGVQRGHDVHVLDQVTEGAKPDRVAELGATYHAGDAAEVAAQVKADVVIEATGASPVIRALLGHQVPYEILVLTGISAPSPELIVDLGTVARDLVLGNGVVVGSVNANKRHYDQAASALAAADLDWLRRLISRRVPLEDFASALEPEPDDVKVVLTLE